LFEVGRRQNWVRERLDKYGAENKGRESFRSRAEKGGPKKDSKEGEF